MSLLCPECLAPLDTSDGRVARCTTHGGQYRILFLRGADAAAPFEVACPQCGRKYQVRVEQVGKNARCQTCQTLFPIAIPERFPLNPPGTPPDLPPPSSGPGRAGAGSLPGVDPNAPDCVNHPAIKSTRQCTSCGAPVCETCAFKFPPDLIVCPACAAAPRTALSPKRRAFLIWSFLCAGGATAFMAALLSGVFANAIHNEVDRQAFGTFFLVVVLGLTLPGIGLSAGARLPRQPTPVGVWIALIWNIVMLAAFMLLCLIGALSGG